MTKPEKMNRPDMESGLFFPVTELRRTICPVAQWADVPVPRCGTQFVYSPLSAMYTPSLFQRTPSVSHYQRRV